MRSRITEIEQKPEEERTEEEMHIWQQYEQRRQRKNNRSRERALEKKEEIDRILAKPDKKRSKIEKQFLETALSAKKRKNEGDRLRRQRLKELGLSTKGTGIKPGISARGPLPPQYQHLAPPPPPHHHYPHPGMPPPGHMVPGDIPMSPLPNMPPPPHHHHHHHHPGMQSPGFGSPGMMHNMGYPSPQGRRGPHGTPGRPDGAPMPYMPPPQGYDQLSPQHRGGPPHPHNSRVEQRRNPDGSMSIQIGGRDTGGSSFGGDGRPAEDMNDVSNLLNEDESGYNDHHNEQQGDEQGPDEGKSE